MPEILINVVNKIPQLTGDVRQITSGNGDYTVRLVFDDDWADGEKTVLFVRENGFAYPAARTENDCCAVPEVNGVPLREWLYIGVKQGDVHTSRPCGIPVYRSIDDMISDEAVQPDPSLWDDILARLIAVEENVDEVVAETVEDYLRENPIGVPTKLSELENDTGFITRLVNDLANYYRKGETYTREEVDGKISAIPKFSIAVVDALPTANISVTTVYLVRSGDDTGDLYTEYIYVDGKWEILGSQRVDLTGYVTDAELTDALKEYAKLTDISAMTGATAAAQGKSGMVPAPAAGQQDMVLHGDGTWRGIEIPETPESVPPGNLIIVVMGESLDELTIVSVQYPADAPEGYQPEDSIAAGDVVVMLALVDQNGEDIAATSMGVLSAVDGDVIQAHMNLVQEDAVTSLVLEADLVSMTARALVYTEFAGGGGAPEASGWVEILPETEGVNDDPDSVLIEIPAVLNVLPGDKCRVYWQGNKLTAEAEVTAVSGDFHGYPAVILADYTGDEFAAENVQTFALWYIPQAGGVVAQDKANSTRCTVRIEKLVGENVTRAEFETLAEDVEETASRTIPTYVLAEGETPEDAPEWAEEVIDPYNDPEGGGTTSGKAWTLVGEVTVSEPVRGAFLELPANATEVIIQVTQNGGDTVAQNIAIQAWSDNTCNPSSLFNPFHTAVSAENQRCLIQMEKITLTTGEEYVRVISSGYTGGAGASCSVDGQVASANRLIEPNGNYAGIFKANAQHVLPIGYSFRVLAR